MYNRIPENRKLALRVEFENVQEYIVTYDAINNASIGLKDLSPEEIWSEAIVLLKEITTSNIKIWKFERVYEQLKQKYDSFVSERGDVVQRTTNQQDHTAILILFDVVIMLALKKKTTSLDKHPYGEFIDTILKHIGQKTLFQSLLAITREKEEEIEKNVTHKELSVIDYLNTENLKHAIRSDSKLHQVVSSIGSQRTNSQPQKTICLATFSKGKDVSDLQITLFYQTLRQLKWINDDNVDNFLALFSGNAQNVKLNWGTTSKGILKGVFRELIDRGKIILPKGYQINQVLEAHFVDETGLNLTNLRGAKLTDRDKPLVQLCVQMFDADISAEKAKSIWEAALESAN